MTFSIIMAQFPLCKTVLKSVRSGKGGGGAFLNMVPTSDGPELRDQADSQVGLV